MLQNQIQGGGARRTSRPVYVDRLPPCNAACPAGEDIQGWLLHAESGDHETAWRHLTRDNPLPAVLGRICQHACEGACHRGRLDEAVDIHSVERFLGDEAIRQGWRFTPPAHDTGQHLLVVGAGASGMSAAFHLRRTGHAVTVLEAAPAMGGMMRHGIPRFRLPREVLDAELLRIVDMGVTVQLGTKVLDVESAIREGGFDACFLAVGAPIAGRATIPAQDSSRILDALAMLRSMQGQSLPMLGRLVAAQGSDNAAGGQRADAALVIYRRTREKMPARDAEVEEALQEGLRLKWLATLRPSGGGDRAVTIEKMSLDEEGKPRPTGEFETLGADSLVLALGQDVDLTMLRFISGLAMQDGVVQVDPATLMTGHPGVFAGGDMVAADRNLAAAVGHGKKAARHIDAWLRGQRLEPRAKPALARFENLHPWYEGDATRPTHPRVGLARRTGRVDAPQHGLSAANARFEARRCLSCGNCFECDNCYAACPQKAVIRLGPGKRYEFDLGACNGCGICAAACPSGAIEMVAEPD